jgi:hypothetical protein
MLILRELFGLFSALAVATALGAAAATAWGFFSDTEARSGSLRGALALGSEAGTETTGSATGARSGAGAGPVGSEGTTDFVALTGSRGSTAMGSARCPRTA